MADLVKPLIKTILISFVVGTLAYFELVCSDQIKETLRLSQFLESIIYVVSATLFLLSMVTIVSVLFKIICAPLWDRLWEVRPKFTTIMFLVLAIVAMSAADILIGKSLVQGALTGGIWVGRYDHKLIRLATDPKGYWFGMAEASVALILCATLTVVATTKLYKVFSE